MQTPRPVRVVHLFSEERAALIELLTGLASDDWRRPTVCSGWSVHDVALHVLGGDLGFLSRRRDGYLGTSPAAGEDVLTFVNRINDEWVRAARRLSPPLLIDLLAFTADPLTECFGSLDLDALGSPVSWVGPEPAPVWLDVAREYTERWHHQQHIRDAVERPGLTEPRFLAPVIATFVHALPHTFRKAKAPPGEVLHFHVDGDSGGDWSVVKEQDRWRLFEGSPPTATARVSLDESIAWRLLTKIISPQDAEASAELDGDERLGRLALRAVAIIA